MTSIFSRAGAPLFVAFFLWSLGTGAVGLARPLFAAELGASPFLVSLVIAASSISQLAAGPLTGIAMDRWGRKPLLISGCLLRAASGFMEFFVTGYPEFLLLELIGGVGVSMFGTGSTILISDLSEPENRGRAVAARNMSNRLGSLSGPLVGAALATLFGLRAIFLMNGVTKLMVTLILVVLIAETHPRATAEERRRRPPTDFRNLLSHFRTRGFAVIALVTFATSMMSQGIFQNLLPLSLRASGQFTTADIGKLLSIAGVATLLISMPNGYAADRYGRKVTLVPGLLVMGLCAYLFGTADEYLMLALVSVLYGMAQGTSQGTSQVYAMDLAPPDRSASFIGVWTFWQSVGTALAPLAIGVLAERAGFGPTYTVVAIFMLFVAGIMWWLGPDTGVRADERRAVARSV